MSDCVVIYLGTVPYGAALKLQHRLMQLRMQGDIPDTMLLLQHPPVFTLGRFKGESDVLSPPEDLKQRGFEVFQTDRGGSVTCHNPGQLVGYPILNLKERSIGVADYIWKLEETIIRLLSSSGIQAGRVTGKTGVWVSDRKICSIGIRITEDVTTHGFALNVNNDLRDFQFIRPCGLSGDIMTSLSEILGKKVEIESLFQELTSFFSGIMGMDCKWEDEKWLDAQGGLAG